MPLDETAVVAALGMLDADYRVSDRPLSVPQREAWKSVLEKLNPGELRPALAHLGYEHRPGPLEVLLAVQHARKNGWPPKRQVTGTAQRVIAQAKKDLKRV